MCFGNTEYNNSSVLVRCIWSFSFRLCCLNLSRAVARSRSILTRLSSSSLSSSSLISKIGSSPSENFGRANLEGLRGEMSDLREFELLRCLRRGLLPAEFVEYTVLDPDTPTLLEPESTLLFDAFLLRLPDPCFKKLSKPLLSTPTLFDRVLPGGLRVFFSLVTLLGPSLLCRRVVLVVSKAPELMDRRLC